MLTVNTELFGGNFCVGEEVFYFVGSESFNGALNWIGFKQYVSSQSASYEICWWNLHDLHGALIDQRKVLRETLSTICSLFW